jgi:hypothetical protein
MEEMMNLVDLTGVLVKKVFEQREVNNKDAQGNIIGTDMAISGSLLLRTSDKSEHEVNYFSKQHKKDGGENSIFKALCTVSNEYKSLEHHPNDADIVKIGAGNFRVNDYKAQDGEVKSYVQISANFANRLSVEEIEKTPQESKFELEGIIESIEPEAFKDVQTGNLRVILNVIGYDDTITPVKLTVMQDMAENFTSVGFFAGGVAKFVGRMINTREVETVVEKMAFGGDNVKEVTKTVSRLEVTGGTPKGSPIECDIKDDEYAQAKSKRKLKLQEIKNKVKDNAQSSGNKSPVGASSGASSGNPFGGNPFNKG